MSANLVPLVVGVVSVLPLVLTIRAGEWLFRNVL